MNGRDLIAAVMSALLLTSLSTEALGADAAKNGQVQADFFVAASGSDQWSGKLAQPNPDKTDGPFQSLARARDAVRELKRQGTQKEIVVLIRGGVYRLNQTVAFSLEDSAPAGGTITYAA